jgi:hypothetical protein
MYLRLVGLQWYTSLSNFRIHLVQFEDVYLQVPYYKQWQQILLLA